MQKAGFEQIAVRYNGDPPAEIRAGSKPDGTRSFRECRSAPSSARTWFANYMKLKTARGEIFAAFSLLAVIIGCLGLFGLAAFTAERRTKEIGIRKVLGARTRDIVQLLVWQFSRPVIVANYRLAGRLVADARLAEQVRRAHTAGRAPSSWPRRLRSGSRSPP